MIVGCADIGLHDSFGLKEDLIPVQGERWRRA